MESFSALLALCAGNSSVTGNFPSQRPVTRSSFDLRLNKQLSKQSRRQWCKTPSHSLWCHWNAMSPICLRLTGFESPICETLEETPKNYNCILQRYINTANKTKFNKYVPNIKQTWITLHESLNECINKNDFPSHFIIQSRQNIQWRVYRK